MFGGERSNLGGYNGRWIEILNPRETGHVFLFEPTNKDDLALMQHGPYLTELPEGEISVVTRVVDDDEQYKEMKLMAETREEREKRESQIADLIERYKKEGYTYIPKGTCDIFADGLGHHCNTYFWRDDGDNFYTCGKEGKDCNNTRKLLYDGKNLRFLQEGSGSRKRKHRRKTRKKMNARSKGNSRKRRSLRKVGSKFF